jgi:RNA polymerase sporulation-specific sigma factor
MKMDDLEQFDIAQLIARAQQDDKEALEEAARRNLPLVRCVLKRFSAWGRDSEELYQQGCMGLVKAIQRFDLYAGLQFSTYAVPMILGELRRFLRDDSPVHVARTDRERAALARKTIRILRQALGREPTLPEIAKDMRMPAAELVLLMETGKQPVSLDSTPTADQRLSWGEILRDPRSDAWMDRMFLRDLISRLPRTEQWLLYLRYAAEKTQAETAELLHMTQVQISRLEARVRVTLREQWNETG